MFKTPIEEWEKPVLVKNFKIHRPKTKKINFPKLEVTFSSLGNKLTLQNFISQLGSGPAFLAPASNSWLFVYVLILISIFFAQTEKNVSIKRLRGQTIILQGFSAAFCFSHTNLGSKVIKIVLKCLWFDDLKKKWDLIKCRTLRVISDLRVSFVSNIAIRSGRDLNFN